jgi:hypothetical protein
MLEYGALESCPAATRTTEDATKNPAAHNVILVRDLRFVFMDFSWWGISGTEDVWPRLIDLLAAGYFDINIYW